ncbi:hypothetical protein Acsp01_19440 [Actinoplanes sp. NBRC 101535]|nr:hypothetical protein Acsp01_19440 [Actinoplanes sp. NBRC 101535]
MPQPGRLAPVAGGVLAAVLGVGPAAQRDHLEASGIKFGTESGSGAPVGDEDGGERVGQPEGDSQGAATASGSKCRSDGIQPFDGGGQ